MKRDRIFYYLFLSPLIAFLFFMVIIPFILIVLSSVGLTGLSPVSEDGFTLKGYIDFFNPARPNLSCLWFTIKVTSIATFLSTLIGYFLALFFKFRNIRLTKFFHAIMKIPLFTPYLVIAFMFWTLLFPRGYIGVIFRLIFVEYLGLMERSIPLISDPYGIGIIVASVWMRFPVAFTMIYGILEMINPAYEEAARTLGGKTLLIIRRIYFPLTRYSLISALTLNFLVLFIAFSIPFILGASWPQFLSVFVYVNAKEKGDWLMGYTTSVVYIAISFLISFLYVKTSGLTKTFKT